MLPKLNLIDILVWLLIRFINSIRKLLKDYPEEPDTSFENPQPVKVKYMDEYEYLDYMELTRMGRGGQSRKRWYL